MAAARKLKVMISSRCNTRFPLGAEDARPLSEIRTELKRSIESAGLFGRSLFDVWINEKAAEPADRGSWEQCEKQARECDIFIALFNGDAGWTGPDEYKSIGVCHMEMKVAHAVAPGKVYILDIRRGAAENSTKAGPNASFIAYVDSTRALLRKVKGDEKSLTEAVQQCVREAFMNLAATGAGEQRRGKGHVGEALDWTRCNYDERVRRMREALSVSITDSISSKVVSADTLTVGIDKATILCRLHAIPDSFGVAAARERVGQPQLHDFRHAHALKKLDGGPIHLVACNKGISESHAVKMLGYPDAIVVSAPFGLYVADPTQAVQLVLISRCRDEASIRLGVQGFLSWANATGQMRQIVSIAKKRKLVVEKLAV